MNQNHHSESGYESFNFIEKTDTSGSKEHSSMTRTLILSPNDKYLSSELLNNITGKLVPSKDTKLKVNPYDYNFLIFCPNCLKLRKNILIGQKDKTLTNKTFFFSFKELQKIKTNIT